MSTPNLARGFRERPISTLLSTGFGAGLTPIAPGTAGSLEGLTLSWVLFSAISPDHRPSITAGVGLLASGLAVGGLGIFVSGRASRAIGAKDPRCIVIDEIAGQLLACSTLPLFAYGSRSREAVFWTASFLLFRLLDVWKPGWIDRAQSLPEGWGIMIDDVLAGLLAAAVIAVTAGFFAAR